MEFDLIARLRARAIRHHQDVVLGIGDDAALLLPRPGCGLVITADVLNGGIHFPAETAAVDIGWKALAVNLSDVAAMGAEPAWCLLSLSLPEADNNWLDEFLDGFLALADTYAVALVGGDTTYGSLSIAVTLHGLVDPHLVLRRDAAQAGDDIWVTGTLGDAAAALEYWQHAMPCAPALRARLDRPQPRIHAGQALAGLAHACIDVSDGLLADLGHLCRASEVAADIWLSQLPTSPELRALADQYTRWRWQTSGGDDYELCFTAAMGDREIVRTRLEAVGVTATRIGRIRPCATPTIRVLTDNGAAWCPPRTGFVHFAPAANAVNGHRGVKWPG